MIWQYSSRLSLYPFFCHKLETFAVLFFSAASATSSNHFLNICNPRLWLPLSLLCFWTRCAILLLMELRRTSFIQCCSQHATAVWFFIPCKACVASMDDSAWLLLQIDLFSVLTCFSVATSSYIANFVLASFLCFSSTSQDLRPGQLCTPAKFLQGCARITPQVFFVEQCQWVHQQPAASALHQSGRRPSEPNICLEEHAQNAAEYIAIDHKKREQHAKNAWHSCHPFTGELRRTEQAVRVSWCW